MVRGKTNFYENKTNFYENETTVMVFIQTLIQCMMELFERIYHEPYNMYFSNISQMLILIT